MSTDRDKTSAEIEREVEATRAGLTATLDELKDRLSPGQLIDQVFDFSKDSGGREFMNSLGGAVRANPIPVLLIGAGIAWLLAGGGSRNRYIEEDETSETTLAGRRRGRARRGQASWADDDPELAELEAAGRRGRRGRLGRAEDAAEDAYHSAVHGAEEAAAGIAGRARDLGARAGRTGARAWDAAAETGAELGSEAASVAGRAASAVGSAAASLAGQAASVVGQAATTVGSAAYSAGRSAGDVAYAYGRSAGEEVYSYGRTAAERAIESVEDAWDYGARSVGGVIEQQPLVAGAIGLAIGAAIGAAIPSTDAEHRLMGERADEIKRRARELAAEQYEQAKQAASHAYEEVREELKAQDLSGVPGEILGEVTERVKAVAETARSAAKEGAEEAMGGSPSSEKKAGTVGSEPKPAAVKPAAKAS
jgi:hypothetical protein